MKKRTGLLLVLALMFALAFSAQAEEFFAEETFGAEESFGEESFFEEEFFAEEESPAEGVTEEALPEEELEDRSAVTLNDYYDWFYQNTEGYSSDIAAWTVNGVNLLKFKPYVSIEPVKIANQVKLKWDLPTYWDEKKSDYIPIKKLPKNIAWHVYEEDPHTGAFFELAKTTKNTVTLKNQALGWHLYIVRLERIKKGIHEEYGTRSVAASVNVEESTMWESVKKLTLKYATVLTSTRITGMSPYITVRMREPVDKLEIQAKVTWKKKAPAAEYTDILSLTDWKAIPVTNGYEYETTIELDTLFLGTGKYNDILYLDGVNTVKSLQVKVKPWQYCRKTVKKVPVLTEWPGKTKTVTLQKFYQATESRKLKPTITRGFQAGWQGFIYFKSDAGTYCKYNVYDGSKLVAITEYPGVVWFELAGNGKAGKHKITVQPFYETTNAKGKTVVVKGEKSEAFTITVASASKAPVSLIASHDYKVMGDCRVQFWNNNPKAKESGYFVIHVQDKPGTVRDFYLYNDLYDGKNGYDHFECYLSKDDVTGNAPYTVYVETCTFDKKGNPDKRFVSAVFKTGADMPTPVKQ